VAFCSINWNNNINGKGAYAKALYDELYADSIVLIIKGRLGKEKTAIILFRHQDSSLTNLPRAFYPAYTVVMYLITSYTFEPKDGVLDNSKVRLSKYFKVHAAKIVWRYKCLHQQCS
jgi:hypothetical protein